MTWYGQAMFLVETGEGKRLVMDPYEAAIGKRPPSLSGDVVTISHNHYDHNNWRVVRGSPRIVREATELALDGMAIKGIAAYHDDSKGAKRGKDIIFKVETDGVTFAHMGDYGEPEVSPAERLELQEIDVLMVPVGGTYTIDGPKARAVVEALKPKIAIPMHYKIPGIVVNIAGVEKFLTNTTKIKRMPSTIEIERDSIPDETEIWLMECA